MQIHLVSSTDSPEFTHLTRSLTHSSIIALDAEWKPMRDQQSAFPRVSLLQVACRLSCRPLDGDDTTEPNELDESPVFLLDLLSIPLNSIWKLLRDVFTCPNVLKLGFRLKHDLIYLSSTFCAQGCEPGFDRVEPYIDIITVYHLLRQKQLGRRISKDTKSLAFICEEVLGIHLSKELQCSDWSQRPLTEEQKGYAAMDAHCLIEIYSIFQAKVVAEGKHLSSRKPAHLLHTNLGLKEVLKESDICSTVLTNKLGEALHILQAIAASEYVNGIEVLDGAISKSLYSNTTPMDASLAKVVRQYGEKILLKESDRVPKASKKKAKRRSPVSLTTKGKQEEYDEWQGTPPWDLSLGGDGCPKFLCDVMVEGLAKHLRCVGIDAAVPYSKKPESRELIAQAVKEKRVLLTWDAKLLRHEYLLKNQIYRVKNLLKNEQLLEIMETFNLRISEDQLMSRCTKCNGRFIQKPLTTEEAVEAAKGFQRIPNCLFNKNLEFWQCMDCNQLYWEGTQYHNAVQKFINVCKLSDR